MAELSLMASAAFSLSPYFQDQTTCRASKVSTTFPGYGNKRDILKSAYLLVCSSPVADKWSPMNLLPTFNLPQGSMLIAEKPVLIDEQDACVDPVLFSFGIVEQCALCEKIGSIEEKVIESPLLSDLMGLKTEIVDISDMSSLYKVGGHDRDHILHLSRKYHITKPWLEFIEDSSINSNILHLDGQVLLTGVESKFKDLLSVTAEFNMLKSFTTSNRQSMVVPYFTRSRGGHARANRQGPISNQIVAPLKSPLNTKLQTPPKKKGKNASKERAIDEKNYFRACENLLSLFVDKKRTAMAALSLKKSGPEIAQILSQFAAAIAGTGLAILLSVACKAANGRAMLNATRFLNAGLGLGFFYLSWSVTGMRDTVAYVSRSSNKLKLTEEEMVTKIESSANAVLHRAAALAAIALLRFV